MQPNTYTYIYGQNLGYAGHVSFVLRSRLGFVWQVRDFGHLRCYCVRVTCCRRVCKLADGLCVGGVFVARLCVVESVLAH